MQLTVFPAHAGMSRCLPRSIDNLSSFPRTRGDEPHAGELMPFEFRFSPHTRG